jgi:hypothetical protein
LSAGLVENVSLVPPGSVIIFVGLLSVGFLERLLKKREWFGILLVIIGLAVVGVADFLAKDTNTENHGRNDIITGDLLIVIAQVITAIQMVVEEKFVTGLDIPPLQAIGWEGVFGFVVLGLLQIPFYFIKAGPPFTSNPHGSLEDAIDALLQIGHSWQLVMAILGEHDLFWNIDRILKFGNIYCHCFCTVVFELKKKKNVDGQCH